MDSSGPLDMDALGAWVGKSETAEDVVTPRLCASLRAMLDHDVLSGRHLAPTGHWALAPAIVPNKELAVDGHPAKGGFLPPVPLPRRMWAASRITCHRPLMVGMAVARTSTVKSVTAKSGSTGPLVFVEVEHNYCVAAQPAVTDLQTIVFRGAATAGAAPKKASADTAANNVAAKHAREWPLRKVRTPAATTLFRYSALTFNSHRIHYDSRYATGQEGYADLIVHGPLVACFLADVVAQAHGDDAIAEISFRAQAPAFVDCALHLLARVDGKTFKLMATSDDGLTVMSGEGKLR